MDNDSIDENKLDGIRDSISPSADHNSVNKLSTSLAGKLKINDENYVHGIGVERYYLEEEEDDFSEPISDIIQKPEKEYSDEEEEEEDFSEEDFLSQMCYYAKTINKPERPQTQYLGKQEGEEDNEDLLEESLLAQMGYLKNEPPKHEPITTPISELNLKSAFKGSREKEGVPAKERRVSWAPGVYDPPILSDYLTVVKIERPKNEMKVKGLAGKNRQKGGGKKAVASEGEEGGGKGKRGGSKGGVGKGKAGGKEKDKKYVDKKQAKKRGGSSSKYLDYGED